MAAMDHPSSSTEPSAVRGPDAEAAIRRDTYRRLIDGFHASAGAPAEQRWLWLMAAHVVGQAQLRLHAASHGTMLGFALQQRDGREALGQLLRLALVPLGHALGRLPAGNVGRATVGAFRPMVPPPPVRALVDGARSAGPAGRAAGTGAARA